MFAPRSTHLPRTYSVYHQPTTTKKNTNKENANALPSKTPSRAGKPLMGGMGTGMRIGLGVKTEGRDRNVLMTQQQTGGGKGKGREGDDIEPKRLFSHGPSKSTTSLPPSKSLSSMPHIRHTHTKTPALSRKKQQFQALRTPAPAFAEPAPTPLPSATRQRRRSRQSLSNISLTPIKAPIEQSFVTPAPVQWEEELSLGSIEETTHEMLHDVREENEVDDASEGDPEYMPPPVEELPYTPAYDHPDLTSIFSTLSALPPMWTQYDDVVIRNIPAFEVEEISIGGLNLKDDEDLEEEWLKPKPKPKPIQPKVSTLNKSKGMASIRGVPPKPTPANIKPATTSRLNPTTIPIPSIRIRPPAPVPRPPPVRHTATGLNGTKAPLKRPAPAIHERDKALFDSWDQEDTLDEFELSLDIDVEPMETGLRIDELKISE
ncbi:hypothetical protein I302_101852 [Kwoniella bestiolae CBS 10118]|uniref:Uncharacterized protein n=1 Tax=Kwoniella bestiolae CBS 10118 TaxID=1296100 RepID=A0A1B9GDD5_9TREE|nr:hypothetical protein I302_00531 [Kwoniella bestiolae CBS 10118]OCF29040.1 hypothetical protein I302_00531 [Kwoniella bestiolae CBS 10118]